jgi:hypothetical protein
VSQTVVKRSSSSAAVEIGDESRLAQLLDPAVADWPLSHLRYGNIVASV